MKKTALQIAIDLLKQQKKIVWGNSPEEVKAYVVAADAAILTAERMLEKEKEQVYYTEPEVLQLLLKLKHTESYDNLYDWFQENKKQTFNNEE